MIPFIRRTALAHTPQKEGYEYPQVGASGIAQALQEAQALESKTYRKNVLGSWATNETLVGRVQCLQMSVGIKIQDTGHARFSAHIGNDAVHPGFVVETFIEISVHLTIPKAFVIVNGKVEKQHFVIGYFADQGLKRRIVPYVALITKHPSLHNPYCCCG